MEWWQYAALMALGAVALAGNQILRARLAWLTPPPAATPPNGVTEADEHRCKHCHEVAGLRREWEAYLEAFNDLDETVERKRRRLAARESRAKADLDEQPPPEIDPRLAARRAARAAGIDV